MRTHDLPTPQRAMRAAFPLMPSAVIEQWLLPFYRDGHWPPDASRLWKSVLRERPVEFWRDVRWLLQTKSVANLPLDDLDADHLRMLEGEYARYRLDPQLYEPRFDTINAAVKTLRETGRLDRPPVVFRSRGGYFEIYAGMDRMAAFLWYRVGLSAGSGPRLKLWVGSHVPGSAARFGGGHAEQV